MKDGKNIERAELLVKRLNGDIELGFTASIDSAMMLGITPTLLRDMLQDLLTEIAALREARAALAEPVREVPGAANVDATVLPPQEHGAWNRKLEAARYGHDAPATPQRAPKLTRAQVAVMERLNREKTSIYAMSESQYRRAKVLQERGLVSANEYILTLTPAGRDALAAAKQDGAK